MSPHAIRDESTTIDFAKFAVTSNAFLPEDSPATVLSDSYYSQWEQIATSLPDLIASGDIRRAVLELPILSTDRLVSEAEWRRAYSMLAYITHSYVWGGDKPEEVNILPCRRWLSLQR